MMRHLLTDAHYAVRRLRARPAYTCLAVLTLALGIGGTAAVFGIARPLLLDPLPYPNAANVGTFWMPGWWNESEITFLRGKYPGFSNVGAYSMTDLTLRQGDAPARLLPGVQVSAEVFDVLGVRPIIGRNFQRGDDMTGAQSVAMISYGLWKELGGSPALIGKPLTLDGTPHIIIGVMPARFWFPTPDIRIWHAQPLDPQGGNGRYALIGRVAPGNDVHHMDAPLQQLTKLIGSRFTYPPKGDLTKNPVLTPLRDDLLGPMRPALIATFAAMGLILLIACTNVAALMLGQVEGRSTELAVRAALGATRGRITQQLVIEALLLGVIAGAVGGVLAAGGFRLLAQALPIGAWSDSAAFDWTMFAAALGVAVFAVLIVVLVPAASLWRSELRDALSRARTGGVQGRGGRLERSLVVAEVSLAMLIATAAGLLVHSVANRYAIDPGVSTKGVAVVEFLVPGDIATPRRRQMIRQLTAALVTLPGVRSAAATMKLPLGGPGDSFGITIQGQPEAERTFTYFRVVSPDYFATMGMHMVAGRNFESSDRPDSTQMPVIINEALAKKYFPGENPIGHVMGGGFRAPQHVIGVVSNASEAELKREAEPVRYYSSENAPWFSERGALVVRTQRPEDAVALLDAARRTVQQVAPGFAVRGTTTMERLFATAVGPVRQVMSLLALLSGLALVLGAVGIYGVISHLASRRKRDWAIRVALGLAGSGVVAHVLRQGLAFALVGIALGALAAAALTRLLGSFLFDVSAIDPIAYAGASALLLVIGAVAAFIPARRAGTVDPALVLREQ